MEHDIRNYSEANQNAETISFDEFCRIASQDDNPHVYSGARKARRIAMSLKVRPSTNRPGFGIVSFDYCNRNGYADHGSVCVGVKHDPPIFHFSNSDRLVKVRGGGS